MIKASVGVAVGVWVGVVTPIENWSLLQNQFRLNLFDFKAPIIKGATTVTRGHFSDLVHFSWKQMIVIVGILLDQ